MNCFVITLKSDKPRYNRVLKIQKTSNFDIKIMDAIDGKTISKNFLNFLLQNNAINKQIIKKFTKGTIGCYLSHMKTWTTIRNNNFNHTIILEDDFKLANNFQEKINLVIEELPEDYDICYFFYHPYSKKYYKNFNKFEIYGKKYIRRQVPTWGLVGYMVSLEGAKKLIDKCHTMSGHIDNQISIDEDFPQHVLVNTFRLYIPYYLKSAFSLSISEKNEYKFLIHAMLYNFQQKNSNFGRKYFKREYDYRIKKNSLKRQFHMQSTSFESPLVLYNSYKNCHKSVENNYAPFVNSYLDYNSKTKQNIHIRFTENMVGLFNSTYDTDVDQDESQEMGSVS